MKPRIATRTATSRDLKTLIALCDALNAHLDMPTGRIETKSFRSALFGRNAFLFADVAQAAQEGRREPEIVGYALSHDAFSTDFGIPGLMPAPITDPPIPSSMRDHPLSPERRSRKS